MSHAVEDHPRWMGHGREFWQNMVHWRREWKTTSVFVPWELHEQYEKEKRYDTDSTPTDTGQWVPNMLLEKSEEITPEGKKRQSQSRNDAQLWICLFVKVKFNAVKKNIA